MSLPITAVGPLKVETNPILMEFAAWAGFASTRAVTPASQNAFLMFIPLLVIDVCRQPKHRPDPRKPPKLRSRVFRFPGDLFCARNLKAAASTNRRLLLEPSAQCQPSCSIIRMGRG